MNWLDKLHGMVNELINQEYESLTTDSQKLTTRISVNTNTQKYDFSEWLFKLFPDVNKSYNILDLGCGTGMQTSFFLDKVGSTGSVCAIDASAQSITRIPDNKKLKKFALDFNNMEELEKVLTPNHYNIINSAYAIYYANKPLELIKALQNKFLSNNGKIIISGPTWPHDLYTLIVNQFGENLDITNTINFMEKTLTPYLQNIFGTYELHYLNNKTQFNSNEEVVAFIKSTTYGAHIDVKELELYIKSLKNLEFRKTSIAAIFS